MLMKKNKTIIVLTENIKWKKTDDERIRTNELNYIMDTGEQKCMH